jgi:hypothetical protein
MSSKITFGSLPDEIIERIVDYVPDYDRFSCEYHVQGPRKRQLMRVALTCKMLCRPALKNLWGTIFDGDFNKTSLELLLKCLPAESKRSLSIYEQFPEEPYLPYANYVVSISLEKLFYCIDTWLERQASLENSPEKRRDVARVLFRQFKTGDKSLEKLRWVGFHENRVWVENYKVILDTEFSQWIRNMKILDIRGTFDFTSLVDELVETCTNIVSIGLNRECESNAR